VPADDERKTKPAAGFQMTRHCSQAEVSPDEEWEAEEENTFKGMKEESAIK
jgi:hypothetical protein